MYNQSMRWIQVLAAALCLGSLVGLLWISLPIPQGTIEVPLLCEGYEQGSLVLNQPEFIRLGDEASINLRVEFSPQVSLSSSTHKIVLLNRLELNSFDLTPRGEGRVLLDADSTAVLEWKIQAFAAGTYQGTLWLFETNESGDQSLLLARPLTLEVRDFLGLKISLMRWILGVILIVGLALFIKKFKIKITNQGY